MKSWASTDLAAQSCWLYSAMASLRVKLTILPLVLFIMKLSAILSLCVSTLTGNSHNFTQCVLRFTSLLEAWNYHICHLIRWRITKYFLTNHIIFIWYGWKNEVTISQEQLHLTLCGVSMTNMELNFMNKLQVHITANLIFLFLLGCVLHDFLKGIDLMSGYTKRLFHMSFIMYQNYFIAMCVTHVT